MRRLLVLIVLSATTAQAQPARRPPAPIMRSDKEKVVAWARETFADPYSLRSTGISDPFISPDGTSGMFCIEFNARNALGGYTGLDRQAFIWTSQGLRPATHGLGGATKLTCYRSVQVFHPFPELSQIR